VGVTRRRLAGSSRSEIWVVFRGCRESDDFLNYGSRFPGKTPASAEKCATGSGLVQSTPKSPAPKGLLGIERPCYRLGISCGPKIISFRTILNLVDRLARRGWLVRRDREKPRHYVAAMGREETAVLLASGFVDDFFAGSASNLVMSLLGSKRLEPREIERLRQVLESTSQATREKKGK